MFSHLYIVTRQEWGGLGCLDHKIITAAQFGGSSTDSFLLSSTRARESHEGFSAGSAEDLIESCLSIPTKAFGMDSMSGDPPSMATQWWATITNGRADVVGELTARLVVPELTNTFIFDDDDDDEQIPDGIRGAYKFVGTDADTCWNQ